MGEAKEREGGLRRALVIEDDANGLRLTTAGIELCKSLQHRVAADAQAEKILQQRAAAESPAGDVHQAPSPA